MKLRYWIITILVLCVIPGVWYALLSKPQIELTNSTPRSFQFRLIPEYRFVYPGSTIESWQWYENELVILDRHSQVWYKLNPDGRILDTLGTAGLAPYENQQVKNFVLHDGSIKSVDIGARVIKSESLRSGIEDYRKVQEAIWDGIPLAGDSFLLLNDASEEFGFFTLFLGNDTPGELDVVSRAFGHAPSQNSNVAYEGFFVRGDSLHYYVCARSGGVIQFDGNGELIRAFETMDKTPPPKIVERRAANLVIFEREPDEIVNYAGTEYMGELYVLSQVAFIPTSNLRVDIYNTMGSYRTSIEIPNIDGNLPINILRSPTHLFVCYEDLTIVGYELQAV